MFGYVLYPDGGCRGNDPAFRYCGGGIHGYRWNLALTPKGIGHTTHAATLRGYDFKADTLEFDTKEQRLQLLAGTKEQLVEWALTATDQVKTPRTDKEKESKVPVYLTKLDTRVPIERYYDCSIPMEVGGTNNTAELLAAILCLEQLANEPDFDQATMIVIRQDSKYVVDNHNQSLATWIENKFIRRDGSSINNPELWLRLNAVSQRVQEKGIKLIFQWVKAHNTDIGNNSADVLATMGLFNSKNPVTAANANDQFIISDPQDYWASNSDKCHPMLSHRYCYKDLSGGEPPQNQYYISSQGKLEEMTGKRTSDDGFAVVRCEKQPHIEEIFKKQISIPRELDYMFQVDLDNVYGTACRYVDIYGTDFLHRAVEHRRHLQTYGEVLVTKELHPPFLTQRLFDNMDILSTFLDDYKRDDLPAFHSTEVTQLFYNVEEVVVKAKKGEEATVKVESKLKPEFIVGFYKLQVNATYKEKPDELANCDITLRFGIDLPDRNSLRKLEEHNPKVYLVTNTLGPGSFMYAVVIETGEALGIWSGINSSIRVIAKQKEKAAKAVK